jgi:hypothetical protein
MNRFTLRRCKSTVCDMALTESIATLPPFGPIDGVLLPENLRTCFEPSV